MTAQTFAVPHAAGHPSSCGYCSPPGKHSKEDTNYKEAAMSTTRLSCEVYQKMIDRGWRRSGKFCYKPDMRKTCCPQYTIKLDALALKAGKSYRRLVHRWNRYVISGEGGADSMDAETAPKRSKGKDNKPFDLIDALHAAETGILKEAPAHVFEVTLEPASYTDEKFELFSKYQNDIHKDDDSTQSGFKRFLVESPLVEEPITYSSDSIPSHLPRNYGSYHQLYKVDGKLMAMAVLDILPNCVSSVYFMYDSQWEKFSYGKLSALREAMLAKEMHDAGALDTKYLYMGYYIYSCQKMRYKGEYSPSYLADPETYEWYPIEKCIPLLQKNRYACFSDPNHCIEDKVPKLPATPDPPLSDLGEIYVVKRQPTGDLVAVPLASTNYWSRKSVRKDFCACIAALGLELAESIFWTI